MSASPPPPRWGRPLLAVLAVVGVGVAVAYSVRPKPAEPPPEPPPPPTEFKPRHEVDTGGYTYIVQGLRPWGPKATLPDVAASWTAAGPTLLNRIERQLADPLTPQNEQVQALIGKAAMQNYLGKPAESYATLERAREFVGADGPLAAEWRYTIVYYLGVSALRRGETENCVMCRGESSCILPLAPAALHTIPGGSRTAVTHFLEYLEMFPDDVQVRWLLNLAHMTLGEHPGKVPPRHLITLDRFVKSEFDIGRFRDVGSAVGINRLNEAGATAVDDFDNDGLLDVFFTTWDAAKPVAFYRNRGDGTFEDRTKAAGLENQLGGLGVVQGDYDNDGKLDLYLPRGAWLAEAVRPTLLHNNGDGTFTDVTDRAGLAEPLNSDTAQWTDFDNDGWLDLFVACEQQPCRLYRNNRDGTFTDVAAAAGLVGVHGMWKGLAWIDYDDDGYPDVFLNDLSGTAKLLHNNGNGTFTDATAAAGIRGPREGMSCWAWDYDNDGKLDIFATTFDRSVEDVLNGMLGKPHGRETCRLYRNLGGGKFADVTREVGLDLVFSPMGSNFGDFDNDGYLDFYLGTGDHDLATLVPNRLMKNVGGKRFADITASSGTGSLQKGHGVGCGDWDRDGSLDIFIQMGGALPGDAYHNVLFQNPGQKNNWLSVKLVGKTSNRSAIGARVKLVTAGDAPLTVTRHVSSGSSFGGNPLEQHLGLGGAAKATLEVYWPTSKTTQVFRDVPANRSIEITEGAADYRTIDHRRVPRPK